MKKCLFDRIIDLAERHKTKPDAISKVGAFIGRHVKFNTTPEGHPPSSFLLIDAHEGISYKTSFEANATNGNSKELYTLIIHDLKQQLTAVIAPADKNRGLIINTVQMI